MSPEESEEGLSELLRLLNLRGVPTVFDHFFPVTPPILGIRLKHGPDLGDHRLRGIHFLPRPPRHHSQLSEVSKVQERSVGDDRVLGAADPEHRGFRAYPGKTPEIAIFGRDGVVHAPGTRRHVRPIPRKGGVTWVVFLCYLRGEHGGEKDLLPLLGRSERRLEVKGVHHVAGRTWILLAPIALPQAPYELGIGRPSSRSGVIWPAQSAEGVPGSPKPVGGHGVHEDQRGYCVWVLHGVAHGYHASHRPANQVDLTIT